MRTLSRLTIILFATAALLGPLTASADTGGSVAAKVTIKADVNASGSAQAATGDALYAKGQYEAALIAYGQGFASTRDAAFIYAQAQCHKALGHAEDSKAMFQMYLQASGSATLKYKALAEAEVGAAAEGTVAKVGKVVGKGKDAVKAVAQVGLGVYSAAEISVAASMKASARAEAKAADSAYASGKYADAAGGYLKAYAKSQQVIALYAAGQAHAQAGNAVEARAVLLGYLAAKPKGAEVKHAKSLLLALGGSADATVKVAVKAKATGKAKTGAGKGDKAFKAGQYVTAVKLYAEAHAKTSDAALIYAKGMAQYYAGATAEAAATLQSYLDAGGSLEFKAQAEATLRATGS